MIPVIDSTTITSAPKAPAPHVFVPHPGYPDKLCAECGWGPSVPCHVHEATTTTGEDTLAPLRSDPAFDYAALERKMWDKVREEVMALVDDTYRDTRIIKGHAVFAAVRSYAFAYRLAKTRPEMDAELIEREVTFLRDLLDSLPASYGKACGLLLAAAGEIYERRTWLAENAERIERTR